jgi:hypothetical protein
VNVCSGTAWRLPMGGSLQASHHQLCISPPGAMNLLLTPQLIWLVQCLFVRGKGGYRAMRYIPNISSKSEQTPAQYLSSTHRPKDIKCQLRINWRINHLTNKSD